LGRAGVQKGDALLEVDGFVVEKVFPLPLSELSLNYTHPSADDRQQS
jgi:hypothetical protein